MRHYSFKIFCLIIWACIAVFSAYSQKAISYETQVLESFNGDDGAKYIWKTDASRFISVVRDSNGQAVKDNSGNESKFPLLTYVDAFPLARFGAASRSGDPIRSLGLHGKFDRKGYNWIDLYPVLASDSDGRPAEIPLPGRVSSIDCWVWGSNLKFYVEVFVRDYRGVIHTLKLGDITYPGWKNLRVAFPTAIPQEKRLLPNYAGSRFVKFRIWTTPTERVDDFYIYFKQMTILTDVFEELFDGNDLADPSHVQQLWSN